MKLKIENIEYELDIKTESLISEIQNCRDEYRMQLDKYKNDFEKYWKFYIFEIKIYKNNIWIIIFSLLKANKLVETVNNQENRELIFKDFFLTLNDLIILF